MPCVSIQTRVFAAARFGRAGARNPDQIPTGGLPCRGVKIGGRFAGEALSSSGIASFKQLIFPRREAEEVSIRDFGQGTESEVSDESLISRICDGDKDALARLFRRYARLVRSVAYKVLRDTFEADDLVQELFLLIDGKSANFDSSKGSARFWILQMTYHRAISRRRYLNRRHFYTYLELEDAEQKMLSSPSDVERLDESIDIGLGRSEMQKLFRMLSENQQLTLRLHFFEGYTLEEIAVKLGQTKENVRHHYFRGLEKLRKQMFRRQVGS